MNDTAGRGAAVQVRRGRAVTGSIVASDVMAGVICGIFVVFAFAWKQGSTLDIDLPMLIETLSNWFRQIYPR